MNLQFSTPEEAEAAFYDAFERADLDAMMAVWANSDDVTCIHPMGMRLTGRDDIRESWRQIFSNGVRLRFELADRRCHASDALAVHHLYEVISVVGQEGTRNAVHATNVFVSTAEGWRMLAHHASPLPSDDGDDEDVPPTLH